MRAGLGVLGVGGLRGGREVFLWAFGVWWFGAGFVWPEGRRQDELKSLILAQIERWRHALHMQVERQHGGNPGGEWRTGE